MSININMSAQSYGQYQSINTNSKQYKAAAKDHLAAHRAEVAKMTPEEKLVYELFGGEEAYMKNVMQMYDSDGNLLNANGIAGMDATGKSLSEMHQIIRVSEDARQMMFDECKRHFIQENGVANGDTTKRSDVFIAYQKSVPIDDRLKGTWTLGQYEKNYTVAFVRAVRAVNPNWQPGQDFDTRILDSVTREAVDALLVKSSGQYGEELNIGLDITI